MSGSLKGVRVIECGGYLSALSACYMLGDLGAEVIKIENRIKGDPSRVWAGKSLPGDLNIMFETANKARKRAEQSVQTFSKLIGENFDIL